MENKNNEQKTSQEIASDVTKKVLNQSLVRNIVVKTTEFLIPIVFWIGIVTIFVISVITAKEAKYFYVSDRLETFVVTFTVTFVPSILAFIVSFYLLFLLKDIRDSLQNQDKK
ncbi:hypothetical protein ACNSOS_09715 [Aliarcobacter vitoriensis]|uniref:hypothetical protein n=1 Tax=Aliarcobacter vitoriensis TaxID=2011099 RepID=UPI003AAE8F52